MRECHEHQSSQMVFGVDFTSVDMIDLVTQQAPWRSCATLKRTRHRAITSGRLRCCQRNSTGCLMTTPTASALIKRFLAIQVVAAGLALFFPLDP